MFSTLYQTFCLGFTSWNPPAPTQPATHQSVHDRTTVELTLDQICQIEQEDKLARKDP